MANFFHLDNSGGNGSFARPRFWVLNARDKKLVGPFMSERMANEYVSSLYAWPRPRVIQSCTTYGLDADNWQNSLGVDWCREEPPFKFFEE